jgi:hypothetical protein
MDMNCVVCPRLHVPILRDARADPERTIGHISPRGPVIISPSWK